MKASAVEAHHEGHGSLFLIDLTPHRGILARLGPRPGRAARLYGLPGEILGGLTVLGVRVAEVEEREAAEAEEAIGAHRYAASLDEGPKPRYGVAVDEARPEDSDLLDVLGVEPRYEVLEGGMEAVLVIGIDGAPEKEEVDPPPGLPAA